MSRRDPAARLARAETDLKAAIAASKAAGQRVADLRVAIDRLEANPLDIPDPGDYAASLDKMRHALASAALEANHANSVREKAAEELEAAKLEVARASADRFVKEADEALSAFVEAANAAAEQLTPALVVVREKIAARDANRAALRKAGEFPARDARTSLASCWPALLDKRPGAVGALATAAAVVAWASPENTERREAEEREFQRRRECERQRAALIGAFGPEEQEKAREKARAELREFYSARGSLSVTAAALDPEIARMRRSAGLDAPERGE